MRVIVIGATGTIGSEVVGALRPRHEVIPVSRQRGPAVDLADPGSIATLFASVGDADAVICCAASAPPVPLEGEDFVAKLRGKLLGQVELVRQAVQHLRDEGAIVLTSGRIPAGTPGSAGGALVNAGLEAFVSAAAVEMPRGIRLNVVSPGWVRESLVRLGMDSSEGIPASRVARAYVEAVEGTAQGRTITVA